MAEVNQKDVFDMGKQYKKQIFDLEAALSSEEDPEKKAHAALRYLELSENLGHLCDFRLVPEAQGILSSYSGSDDAIKSMMHYYAPKPKPKPVLYQAETQ